MKTALQAAALALFLPAVVAAQSASFSPSLAVSEVYDGNLFASATDRQASLVHRFGPRLELDGRSAPFSLIGHYMLDADYVQALPDTGVQLSRQLGSLQLRYQPMQRLTLEGDVTYLDTRTLVAPGIVPALPASDMIVSGMGLNTTATVDRGRLRAHRFYAAPAVSYQIERRTRAEAGYLFTRDTLLDLVTEAHVAHAAVAYRFTHADTGTTTLLVRKFVFDADMLAPSEVVLLGWSHRFARRTTAELGAGPRFRTARVDGIEGNASLRQGFGHSEVALSYSRSETVTLGLPGSREIDEAALTASTRLRAVLMRANSGIARTHGNGVRADLQFIQLAATTQIQPWLSAEISVALSWQKLVLGDAAIATTVASGRIFHDFVALTLVVAPPKPLEL